MINIIPAKHNNINKRDPIEKVPGYTSLEPFAPFTITGWE